MVLKTEASSFRRGARRKMPRRQRGQGECGVMAMGEQARRVLLAVHSLSRLQNSISLSVKSLYLCSARHLDHPIVFLEMSVAQSFTIRPFDAVRIVGTFIDRLDALEKIAGTYPTITLPEKGRAQEFAYTVNGFRILMHSCMRLRFKLSIVAKGIWKSLQSIRYGSNHNSELTVHRPDEAFIMVATTANVPSGGPTALRRVFEDDGSVPILHTVLTTAPPSSKQSLEEDASQNLLAGCTVKQAGWDRLRLVSSNHGRPLVLVASATAAVVEASLGCSFSRDRQQRLLKALRELSSSKPRTRQSLENELMDLSLASQKA